MSESKSDQALIETARQRFKLCLDTESKQREREKDDLRFQVPDLQWDDASRRARAGDGAIAARPMLSVDRLSQPVRLTVNQMRAADLGIDVQPVSEDADKETAEMLQGLYRAIERKSHAELSRAWAFDRAVKAGRGAYRVMTEYDDSSPEPTDQCIVIRRILHQEGVFFDPAATEPDFSDGEFAFVTSWMTKDEFARAYPKAESAKGLKGSGKFSAKSLEGEAPDWVREGDVQVAEYFYKVHKDEKLPNGSTRDRVSIKWVKMSGWEVLEEADWPGKHIPLVPVFGDELQPFDKERRWTGIINPAKDAQRLYNHGVSNLVERVSLEPKAPWVATAEQVEGYEDMWNQSNSRNFPILLYNGIMKDGQFIPPPARAQIDQSGSSLSMLMIQEADRFIQASTAIYDPSLGRASSSERSGKAILALQQQADAGTSQYLQNLVDISMPYEAKVVLDLIPIIYDRPERVVRIVRGDDKKAESVMLNAPFTMQDGQPVPAPDGAPQGQPPGPPPMQGPPPEMAGAPPMGAGPEMGGAPMAGPGGPPMGGQPGMPPQQPMAPPPPPQPKPPEVKHYDLRKGVYDVSVSVGKSFQTRLQEGSEAIGNLLAQRPELFQIVGDLWLRFQTWPGAREMAERLTKMREKAMPGLGEGEDGAPTPEQLQAQVQQLTTAMEQAKQQLAQAAEMIKTETVKREADLKRAMIDAQAKVKVAEIQAQARLEERRMQEQGEDMRLEEKLDHVSTEALDEKRHEAEMDLMRSMPVEPEPPEMGEAEEEGI